VNPHPIVFVHGTPLDRRAWQGLVAELPGARCLTYDLRGHGAAADEDLPSGYDVLADDLAQVLDTHGLDRAHVVGHSFGGQVAAAFATRHAARAASATIVCCRLEPYPPFWEAADAISSGAMAAVAEAAIARWFTAEAVGRDEPGVRYARERFAAVRPSVLAAALRLIADFDGLPALAASGVPVRIVAAEHDVVGEPAGLRAAASALGASFALAEGVGHMLPVERPAQLARLLRST
jgi:pimeloyl-ACP methyl ester carboxylesterase